MGENVEIADWIRADPGRFATGEASQILRLAELPGCRNVRVFCSLATRENRAASDVDFQIDLDEGRNLFDLVQPCSTLAACSRI